MDRSVALSNSGTASPDTWDSGVDVGKRMASLQSPGLSHLQQRLTVPGSNPSSTT